VISLLIAHIIAIWDSLYADCESLIYKIGNVKLSTMNEIRLTFVWFKCYVHDIA